MEHQRATMEPDRGQPTRSSAAGTPGGDPLRVPQPLAPAPMLGLRANLGQFLLLVLINGFVGAMVGLERDVVPLLGARQFGLASATASLSFIVSFGVVKALANVSAGHLSDRLGRKGVLVVGWFVGLPIPFLLILAPSWGWIIAANVLLGVNQGLCWSTTVIMKIDLVGPARRGLAMGLNEAAGYGALALAAAGSGYLAATYGLRPWPFVPGVAFALMGLLLSALFVRESRDFARHEARLFPSTLAASASARDMETALAGGSTGAPAPPQETMSSPSFAQVLLRTSWRDQSLSAVSQAGLVNNLNDGLAWGLFPLFFAAGGLGVAQIGLLAGLYPGVWGAAQLATGALSDRVGRKPLIVGGMWLQAVALVLLSLTHGFAPWVVVMVLLGLGTALVYPTFLAAVSDLAHPSWRASAVGVYRLWRDSGYAVGALLSGLLADHFGLPWAIAAIAALTFASGAVVLLRMRETLQGGGAVPGEDQRCRVSISPR
ncbi:MAG TPA: MFS transporter [Ktedonobacterales bacterium]